MLVCNKEVISSKCQVISSNVCDMPCFYSFLAGWWSREQFIKGLFLGIPNIKYIFFNQHYYILFIFLWLKKLCWDQVGL